MRRNKIWGRHRLLFCKPVIKLSIEVFALGVLHLCFALFGILLLSTDNAQGQFRARTFDIKPNDYIQLECAPVRISPREKDTDPVYKINVSLEFSDRANVESLYVGHTTMNGNFYVRSDQYNQTALDQPVPFKTRWIWRGMWKRNTNVSMLGDVTRNANGAWFYTETLFRGGRVVMVMESRCHTLLEGE